MDRTTADPVAEHSPGATTASFPYVEALIESEQARLSALVAYNIPDGARDPGLDDTIQLAASIFEAPMSAICLVADGQLWFPAELGLGVRQAVPAPGANLAALLQSGFFLTPDSGQFPLAHGFPLRAYIPDLQFYAGAAIQSPAGLPLGVLCVLDTRPRPDGIDERRLETLRLLAGQVTTQLEKRRLEAALFKAEQRLDTVFNQVSVGILQRDFSHRVLMVNEQFCKVVGRSPDELSAIPMSAFTHPDDMEWSLRVFEEHKQVGKPFQIEKRYVRPDGSIVWCNVNVSFICDEHGNLSSTIAIIEDVTDRRAAEQEIRTSRELLQTVIDSVPETILVTGQSGQLVLANRAAAEQQTLLPGVKHPDLLLGPSLLGRDSDNQRVMMSGQPLASDDVVEIHGEPRVFHSVKVPWFHGGAVAGVVTVARDITDRKRALEALRESEAHYRYSVELNPQIPWTALPDGRIEEVGPQWTSLTGVDPAEACGHGWLSALHPDDVDMTKATWEQAVQSGSAFDMEYRVCTRDGGFRWSRARAAPRRDATGAIVRWYGTLEDIHEHKLANEAVRASEEQLQLAIEAAGIGIWDLDLTTGALRWSERLRALFCLDETAPEAIETVMPLVHPEDRSETEAILRGGGSDPDDKFRSSFRLRHEDDWRWIAIDGHRLRDQRGQPRRLILSMRDITERRVADERIRWAATHDTLTGLPNRTLFQERLDEAMARAMAASGRVGLLLLDVDEFKRINDTLGHGAGDALLKELSERLKAVVDDNTLVARLAGDEFVILLENFAGVPDVEAIARTALERLREPFPYEGHILDCRASIGASVYPDHASDASELFKYADISLYTAKKSARGGLEVFRPEMRAEMQRRVSMLHLAREALESNQIFPFYQPKVDLNSGEIKGFEALLRWRHGFQGIQPPGMISAAFEEFELAVGLGQRMLKCVLQDMRCWLDMGIEFGHVAINASAAEFRHNNFAERILEGLRESRIPNSRLELEVTETVFLGAGADYVERALRTLSAEGIRIALDDFGTGYASLSHLKQFPVDTLKIDRSFVQNLESSASDAAIASAVASLGRNLGIAVVAEGIETSAQADYLRSQGCNIGQGYLYGKPMPASDVVRLVPGWEAQLFVADAAARPPKTKKA